MNFYDVLGDEGETLQQQAPVRTQTQTKPSGSGAVKPQGQRNDKGGNNRPPKQQQQSQGTDPVDPSKKGRGPKRADERKQPKTDKRLERHSGTGRSYEVKKSGHGVGNVGKQGEELTVVEEQTVTVEEKVAEPEPETEEQKKKREEEEKKREEERIKEEKQITFDEYLKSKKNIGLTLPPPRVANEGSSEQDKKKWASLPVEKDFTSPVVPVVAKEEKVEKEEVKSGNEHLNVLGEIFKVRIKDDAFSRRKQQKADFEKRDPKSKPQVQQQTTGASLLAEDPRIQPQKKKYYNKGKVPTKEDFPTLGTKA